MRAAALPEDKDAHAYAAADCTGSSRECWVKKITTTMRYFIIILISLLFIVPTFGQDKTDFFFDEFSVSANRTNIKNENTSDRYGFGIGAYHSFLSDKKINLIFGTEYNRTSQFIKNMYEGHFANSTDLTYNINCISIPVGLRINIGKKIKFFIETGGYADLIISSNRKGTMHTYLPDANNHVVYKDYQIDEKAGLSNSVGVYFGIGLRIPISKYELIIKPDYKFGLNDLYSYMDDIYNRYFRLTIGLKIN